MKEYRGLAEPRALEAVGTAGGDEGILNLVHGEVLE